jgi:hypothetical protein
MLANTPPLSWKPVKHTSAINFICNRFQKGLDSVAEVSTLLHNKNVTTWWWCDLYKGVEFEFVTGLIGHTAYSH